VECFAGSSSVGHFHDHSSEEPQKRHCSGTTVAVAFPEIPVYANRILTFSQGQHGHEQKHVQHGQGQHGHEQKHVQHGVPHVAWIGCPVTG